MNPKMITAGALAGLIFTGAAIGTVSAQTAAEATGLTEAQAIEIALLEVPGEVTEVEREREDGVEIFEIEILAASGEETELEIDAQTGEILEVATEDGKDGKNCGKDREDA